MITIKLQGFDDLAKEFGGAAKQMPYAYSVMVNNLAFMVRSEEIDTINKVFDRPKPQTARNVFVKKGNKSRPSAMVFFDQIYEKGIYEYMTTHSEGGTRKMKRSEKLMGRFYVPGAGAKMDRYGNMQGSQLTQVLSRLRRFQEMGWSMNQTTRSAGKRRGAAKSTEYFMVKQKTGGLVPGVYQRTQSGAGFGAKTARSLPGGSFQKGRLSGKFSSVIRGRGVKPIMIFTDRAPNYKKRFPFHQVADQVIEKNYRVEAAKAIEYAMRTAR